MSNPDNKKAILPITEMPWDENLWGIDLHVGYMHAGLIYNNDVTICQTTAEVKNAVTSTILLDISESTSDDAYFDLCELAVAARQKGYELTAQIFGD